MPSSASPAGAATPWPAYSCPEHRALVQRVDDAAAGQRGTRAIASAELERFLREQPPVRRRSGRRTPNGTSPPRSSDYIVLLEQLMDLGASVAFVSEPAASGAMLRPPQADPRTHEQSF